MRPGESETLAVHSNLGRQRAGVRVLLRLPVPYVFIISLLYLCGTHLVVYGAFVEQRCRTSSTYMRPVITCPTGAKTGLRVESWLSRFKCICFSFRRHGERVCKGGEQVARPPPRVGDHRMAR